MNPRNLIGALAVVLASGLAVAQPKTPEEALIASYKTPNYKAPHAQDGHADLQGVWSNNVATPLQRPKGLEDRPYLTDEEVVALKNKAHELFSGASDFGAGSVFTAAYENVKGTKKGFTTTDGKTGDYNSLWQVGQDWTNRTSLIIDPPNGKLPELTARGKELAARPSYVEGGRNGEAGKRPDSYEDLGLGVRCISFGAPRIGGGYNSYMQIVQSAKTVVVLQETIHDARIIPVDGSPHLPANVKLMHGDSRGHWEGDTLVVDTTNYQPDVLLNNSGKLHVIERIQRTAQNYLTWTVTFDDPDTWVKPWTVEIPLRHSDDALYEYACHEGNYGMRGILAGARAEDAKEAAGSSTGSGTR
jgi:hypothetical protein